MHCASTFTFMFLSPRNITTLLQCPCHPSITKTPGLQRVSLADIAVYNNCTYIRAMDETPMQLERNLQRRSYRLWFLRPFAQASKDNKTNHPRATPKSSKQIHRISKPPRNDYTSYTFHHCQLVQRNSQALSKEPLTVAGISRTLESKRLQNSSRNLPNGRVSRRPEYIFKALPRLEHLRHGGMNNRDGVQAGEGTTRIEPLSRIPGRNKRK